MIHWRCSLSLTRRALPSAAIVVEIASASTARRCSPPTGCAAWRRGCCSRAPALGSTRASRLTRCCRTPSRRPRSADASPAQKPATGSSSCGWRRARRAPRGAGAQRRPRRRRGSAPRRPRRWLRRWRPHPPPPPPCHPGRDIRGVQVAKPEWRRQRKWWRRRLRGNSPSAAADLDAAQAAAAPRRVEATRLVERLQLPLWVVRSGMTSFWAGTIWHV